MDHLLFHDELLDNYQFDAPLPNFLYLLWIRCWKNILILGI